MKGLKKDGNGYAVVRLNSTSGPWIAERTSENVLKQSIADIHIHSVWTTKREAERVAKRMNISEWGGSKW